MTEVVHAISAGKFPFFYMVGGLRSAIDACFILLEDRSCLDRGATLFISLVCLVIYEKDEVQIIKSCLYLVTAKTVVTFALL